MPKPLKVRRANEIVGLFIILALAIIAAAVLLGPRTQRWFTPARTLAIQLPPEGSLGLREGADVQILGSVVGTVEDITVTEAGEMQAEVSIRGNFIRFVRKDSLAIIRKPLGIGAAAIEITRGHGDAVPLKGAVLASVADKAPTQMLDETLAAFRNEALPAIKEVRGAISEYSKLAVDLRSERGDVQQVIDHLNKLGASLESGSGLAAMVLHDPKPPVEMREALAKINSSLDELHLTLRDARQAAARFPAIADDVGSSAKNVREASDQARQVAAQLPALEVSAKNVVDTVPGLILQVQETSRQVQRLTEALQRNWLVRGDMEGTQSGARINADRVGTDR